MVNGGVKRRAGGNVQTSVKRVRTSAVSMRRVEQLINRNKESGFVDLALTTLALNTTGTIILIATVPQGASTNERIGKKIMWKSMQIRGTVSADTATLTARGAWMVVYDNRPDGSLPAVTDVLVTANSDSFTNDANSGRFRILKRMDYAMNGNSATAAQNTSSTIFSVNEFLSLRSAKAEFMAAGTGAIGDISVGALYLIGVGNQAAGTGDGNAFVGVRTRYVDQ